MREKFENLCDWWEGIKNELSRYWTIAKLALLQEKATKDSKVKGMNEHEKEFLPAVLEVTDDRAAATTMVPIIREFSPVPVNLTTGRPEIWTAMIILILWIFV